MKRVPILRLTAATPLAAVALVLAGASAALAQTAVLPAPLVTDPDVPVAPATPGDRPSVVMTVRGGITVSPSYFGSDDYRLGPDAAVRFDFVHLPGGFEWGSAGPGAAGTRSGWDIRGSARYVGGRDTGIAGLDDVDTTFEAGFGLGYEQRNYRVFTDVRYGVVGTNAWTGEIGADGIARPLDGLVVSFGPRLAFGDDRFASTYFGVTPTEAAASGLPAYSAEGGLYSAGVEVGARYMVGTRWGVEGAASWNRLVNSAGDSPIPKAGSEDQYQLRLGITRSISLDF